MKIGRHHSPPHYSSEETLRVASKLIGFKTVSRDSNLELIEWVKTFVEEIGAAVRLTHEASGKEANLFARAGIVLSGHSVVLDQDLACLGRFHSSVVTFEQQRADFFFKQGNLPAEA